MNGKHLHVTGNSPHIPVIECCVWTQCWHFVLRPTLPDPSRRVRRNPGACTSSREQTLIHANGKTPDRERLDIPHTHPHPHFLSRCVSIKTSRPETQDINNNKKKFPFRSDNRTKIIVETKTGVQVVCTTSWNTQTSPLGHHLHKGKPNLRPKAWSCVDRSSLYLLLCSLSCSLSHFFSAASLSPLLLACVYGVTGVCPCLSIEEGLVIALGVEVDPQLIWSFLIN